MLVFEPTFDEVYVNRVLEEMLEKHFLRQRPVCERLWVTVYRDYFSVYYRLNGQTITDCYALPRRMKELRTRFRWQERRQFNPRKFKVLSRQLGLVAEMGVKPVARIWCTVCNEPRDCELKKHTLCTSPDCSGIVTYMCPDGHAKSMCHCGAGDYWIPEEYRNQKETAVA